mgnify:CR=1 FL=1
MNAKNCTPLASENECIDSDEHVAVVFGDGLVSPPAQDRAYSICYCRAVRQSARCVA